MRAGLALGLHATHCRASVRSSGGVHLSAELLTNTGFDTDTVWVKGTGWTISGGVAVKVPTAVTPIRQVTTILAGYTHRLVFTLGRNAGAVTPQLQGGSTALGTQRNASGTYTEDIVAGTGNVNCYFNASSTFDGTLDNVSLKRIL